MSKPFVWRVDPKEPTPKYIVWGAIYICSLFLYSEIDERTTTSNYKKETIMGKLSSYMGFL
jgi:hypothetical protein